MFLYINKKKTFTFKSYVGICIHMFEPVYGKKNQFDFNSCISYVRYVSKTVIHELI